MKYSFIKPDPKPLLTASTKIWIFMIVLVVGSIFAANYFILSQTKIIHSDAKNMVKENAKYEKDIQKIQHNTKIYLNKTNFIEEIYASNETLKKEIKNIFTQIPNSIILTKVMIKNNSLILKGLSKSREEYHSKLLPKLKARYDINQVEFYENKDGYYDFISKNKTGHK